MSLWCLPQVSAQTDLPFWRRCGLKNFKMVTIPEWDNFSNSESPCCPNASHQVWAQSRLAFGSRCGLKIFKMAKWQPSWILEQNNFSNSESPCLPSSSTLSDKVREEMLFEQFQDLGYWNGMILAILNLHVAPMPPTKFHFNLTYNSGGDVENVKS